MNSVTNTTPSFTVSATGSVRQLLRLEALSILAVAASAYFMSGGSIWLFAVLFFVPDLSFAAYAVGPRLGAIVYNAAHSYILAALLAGAGWFLGMDLFRELALIVTAHAAFDRSLGYGLKYVTAFNHTHLGVIGKRA